MKLFSKGFTLIELIVTIAIIAVLSGIVLFSISQYISRGKDSNISANLAILIPAGEVFYNGNGNSYNDGSASFCNPNQNSVIKNAIAQMPVNPLGPCQTNAAGLCCYAESQAWAACAQEFTDTAMAFCVDSRGVKEVMCSSFCTNTITNAVCPDVTSCL